MLLLQFSFIGLSFVSRSSSSSDNTGSSDSKMISSSSSLSDELSANGKRLGLFAVSVITLDFCCHVLRQTSLGVAFGYEDIVVKMLISCRPSSDVELVGCSASIQTALLSVTTAGKNISSVKISGFNG